MTEAEIETALVEFVRAEFLWGDEGRELDVTTPLLEWGIIDSLRTVLLQAHVRDKLGVEIPAALVDSHNFKNIRNIAKLVHDLAGSAQGSVA